MSDASHPLAEAELDQLMRLLEARGQHIGLRPETVQRLRRELEEHAAVKRQIAAAIRRGTTTQAAPQPGAKAIGSSEAQQAQRPQESERRFRSVFDNAAVGICVVDTSGALVNVNQKLCDIVGYSKDELLRSTFYDLTHPEDMAQSQERFQSLMRSETHGYSFEKRYIHRDGRTIWVNCTTSLQRDQADLPPYSITIIEDITQRKQAEQALRDSEAKFRSLFENSPDATFLALPDGTNIAANPAACAMFGMSQEELCRVGRVGITDPADPRLAAAVQEWARTGKVRAEVTFIRKDGTRFPAEVHSVIVDSEEPQAVITLRDIGQRQAAEQALRDSEQRFHKVFDEGPLGMALVDLDRRFVQANAQFCQMLGRSQEELAQLRIEEVTHPEDAPANLELLTRLLRGEVGQCQIEKRYQRKDGGILWAKLSVSLLRSQSGAAQYFLGMIENITARKASEAHLSYQQNILRRLIDSNIIGIVQSDTERVLDANEVFLGIVGYSRDELLAGKVHWRQFTPAEYAPLDERGVKELMERGACTPYEKEYLRKDGSRVPVLIGAAKLTDSPLRWIAFIMDLSRRKRVEAELRAAKEAAEHASSAKDHFLAVLSHELRTPLTPVLAMAQMMGRDSALAADQREAMDMIRRNVELEARLIDDLLDLTRISRGKLELRFSVIDLHARLEHVIQMCQSDIRAKQLALTVEKNAVRRHVPADGARLQQIIWNLLKNAVKFTPPGGSIVLRTESTAHRIRLTVRDTGIGIDSDLLPRLFNAFEQGGRDITRQFGGLGLGLAISKGLVDLHGGTLAVHSEGRGKGATLTLELPLSASTEPEPPAQELVAAQRALAPPRRILLVEDHADTSKAMARLLQSYGFEVTLAATVTSALQVARSQAFDLLISDIGLPDGSGLDLMRELRTERPVRGIALSGYGMEEDVQRSKEAGFAVHLTKPVDLPVLEEALRQVLA